MVVTDALMHTQDTCQRTIKKTLSTVLSDWQTDSAYDSQESSNPFSEVSLTNHYQLFFKNPQLKYYAHDIDREKLDFLSYLSTAEDSNYTKVTVRSICKVAYVF